MCVHAARLTREYLYNATQALGRKRKKLSFEHAHTRAEKFLIKLIDDIAIFVLSRVLSLSRVFFQIIAARALPRSAIFGVNEFSGRRGMLCIYMLCKHEVRVCAKFFFSLPKLRI